MTNVEIWKANLYPFLQLGIVKNVSLNCEIKDGEDKNNCITLIEAVIVGNIIVKVFNVILLTFAALK